MKLFHYIIPTLTMLGVLTACSDYEDALNYQSYGRDSLYVELTFDFERAGTVTRAVPNGGEEGDGWEYARENENKLHNFTVFVIGSGADINSAANTPFFGSRYFSDEEVARVDSFRENLNLKDYDPAIYKDVLTYSFSIPIIASRDEINPLVFRFIVVANAGDLTATYHTVGALREGIPEKTWTEPTEENALPTRFVMCNENDEYYASGTGEEDDPVRLHVTVERLAARIDFLPTGSEVTSDGLRYSIGTATDPLAYLYVDRLAIMNGCQKPSFFVKRVADDINGTNLVYLGDETPAPRGIATNFVIDPYSTQKTEANRTNTEFLTNLYGDSRIGNVATMLSSDASLMPTITNTNSTVILGYVNENTFAKESTFSEYATGVIFQCRYAPVAHYYTAYDADSDVLTSGTYTLGSTFYMTEPNTSAIDETQRFYFENQVDAEAYAEKHFCKVVTYTNGVCYYVTYLRHSNNVEVIHDTMEFGIVRNNIYRMTLKPTTGPGTPNIETREPEELKARIYVRKWYSVEHPIIYI